MKEEDKKRLFGIGARGVMNFIAIWRYIEKVPKLIDSYLSEKDIEAAKAKFEIKDTDWELIKAGKIISNAFVSTKHSIDNHIPNQFNNSSLLLVFATLEDTSRELGKIARLLSGSKLKLKEINERNDVVKAKIYLEKHIGINLSEANKQWDLIRQCTKVRNAIIHANSRINKDNTDGKTNLFRDYLRNEDNIYFDEEMFYITDIKYVEEFLFASYEYLVCIGVKLYEKYNETEPLSESNPPDA